MAIQLCEESYFNTEKKKQTVYVAREIFEYDDADTASHERLLGVFTSIKDVEKALVSALDKFYDWYWKTYVHEESDHDKAERASFYGDVFYGIHRLETYNENLEIMHEWQPYCLKVDIVEVK